MYMYTSTYYVNLNLKQHIFFNQFQTNKIPLKETQLHLRWVLENLGCKVQVEKNEHKSPKIWLAIKLTLAALLSLRTDHE